MSGEQLYMSALEEKMHGSAELVAARLEQCLKSGDPDLSELYNAMSYSALAGGKRIRPFLVMAVCDMFSGNAEEALLYATAIEMVHTYSLIHDDLPAMDNDDMRRGKPTCHKAYGEARAILAGDALLTMAFELVSGDSSVPDGHRVRALYEISKCAGSSGMIGGQEMDIALEGQHIEYETMVKIHMLKTVELIKCACRLGAIAADISDEKTLADIDCYAEGIGRVFQLVDDLLDVSSTDEKLGKTTGSDEKNKKTTYLSFMPAEIAEQLADVMTEKAVEALKDYENSKCLCDFALFLKDRKK